MKNHFETIVYFDDENGNPLSEDIPNVPKKFIKRGHCVKVSSEGRTLDLRIFRTEQDRDGTLHAFCVLDTNETETMH